MVLMACSIRLGAHRTSRGCWHRWRSTVRFVSDLDALASRQRDAFVLNYWQLSSRASMRLWAGVADGALDRHPIEGPSGALGRVP